MARLRVAELTAASLAARLRVAELSAVSATTRLRLAELISAGIPAVWERLPEGTWHPSWRIAPRITTNTGGGNPPSSWTPADLADIPRPTGEQYVRWEDIAQEGDDLEAAFNRVPAGKILTLPEGVWEFTTFSRAYMKGMTFGRSQYGYPGTEWETNTGCVGIVGSGRGTIIRPSASIATANPSKATGDGYIRGTSLEFYRINGLVLSNFSLTGKPTANWDGDYFTGLVIDGCHGARLDHLYLEGASPGYGNSPPGETFGLNMYRSNNVTIEDCEIDGRHKGAGSERVCASAIGWNGSGSYPSYSYAENAVLKRTYAHHGKTGMPTFWVTRNITTEDVWTFSNGTGTGSLASPGINQEQVQGTIVHTRPHTFLHKTLGTQAPPYPLPNNDRQPAGGFHITLQVSDLPGAGVMTQPDMTVIEPVWDMAWSSTNAEPGGFMMESNDGYFQNVNASFSSVITVPPTVIHNGVTLGCVHHPNSGWQHANPDLYYAWIH